MYRGKFRDKAQIRTSLAPENNLALAGLGGFLHLPFFGHDRHVQQAERQNHHQEYECHGLNLIPWFRLAKVTVVPEK
jgi:hypothetical protein